MKKILIIDNTFDPPHGCPEIRASLETAAKKFGAVEITHARAPESKIPKDLKSYDGVVLSGSKTRISESAPWIDLEMQAVRQLHESKIPTFGICYGEQLIAKTLGGAHFAKEAVNYEYGWVEVEKQTDAPLLAGLPNKFYAFELHADEVCRMPPGFRLLASSERCPIQAYEVEGAPMWAVQFHPERTLKAGGLSLDNVEKKGLTIINKDNGPRLFDPVVGNTLFSNFLALAWKKN